MLVWVSLYEFDKFKFKTWKTIEPGKSHVGVSESFWIWRIQNQYLKKVNLWISQQLILWPNNHLHNHKRSSCHVNFNPNVLKKELPNSNIMICEQTFTWLGCFKKILNSLPKHCFDFMLHRLIIHRNCYTEYCHSVNKYPLLPSVKPTKKNLKYSLIFLFFHLFILLSFYM